MLWKPDENRKRDDPELLGEVLPKKSWRQLIYHGVRPEKWLNQLEEYCGYLNGSPGAQSKDDDDETTSNYAQKTAK